MSAPQHELDAADMHVYPGGGIDDPQPLEAHSVVRVFTGPGRNEFLEITTHRDGWVVISGWGQIEIKPCASNMILARPEGPR